MMGNIVGGDCQCWCEIALVGIVGIVSGHQTGRPVHQNNTVQHSLSHLSPNGSRWTQTNTHTYLFHLGIPSLCIGSQWPAKTLQQHTHTHLNLPTPGSKPWTVNMFGPPSDRRLIQRECCKLCHTHTHTSCPLLHLLPSYQQPVASDMGTVIHIHKHTDTQNLRNCHISMQSHFFLLSSSSHHLPLFLSRSFFYLQVVILIRALLMYTFSFMPLIGLYFVVFP